MGLLQKANLQDQGCRNWQQEMYFDGERRDDLTGELHDPWLSEV